MDEAEQALRAGIEVDAATAYVYLSELLINLPGREQEAETTLRDALAAGSPDARYLLGLLSRQLDRRGDAERAFRDALDHGDVRAAHGLLDLLIERAADDENEPELDKATEEVLRAQVVAGEPGLGSKLGALLTMSPGRFDEGIEMLSTAAGLGDEVAAELLRNMPEKWPES